MYFFSLCKYINNYSLTLTLYIKVQTYLDMIQFELSVKMTFQPVILLVFNFYLGFSVYTNETPVKLLEVESLADRYPASESEYRTSVTNGFVSF